MYLREPYAQKVFFAFFILEQWFKSRDHRVVISDAVIVSISNRFISNALL